MAQPRVFISSTCYDLQEIRNQLRSFIENFGLIPVMSEFGDIFYDYKKHIQESCKDEIEKSQLFILIIGNNYGSLYFKQSDPKLPDSVTLQEYRKAIENNIYKHIFVNKFVDYDYKNYKKALQKYLANYLDSKKDIDDKYQELVSNFNANYSFPQDSYKYIFSFLDIIYQLKANNAIIVYESFEDIKESLRKQWSGFMYDSLMKNKILPINVIDIFIEKIERVENQIKLLVEGHKRQEEDQKKIVFDLTELAKDISLSDFKIFKNELQTILDDLLQVYDDYGNLNNRLIFKSELTPQNIDTWLISLEDVVKKYKWSKTIPSKILFKSLNIKYEEYNHRDDDVPFDIALKLYNLYINLKKLDISEYDAVTTTITTEFNKYVIISRYDYPETIYSNKIEDDDEVPF